MTDRVVNLRDFRYPRSRGGFNLPLDVARVDRDSRWGNPYRIGDRCTGSPNPACVPGGGAMTRDDVIRHYRVWARARLYEDPAFLEPLRGKRLACWCAPLPCHGDVIVELLDAKPPPPPPAPGPALPPRPPRGREVSDG